MTRLLCQGLNKEILFKMFFFQALVVSPAPKVVSSKYTRSFRQGLLTGSHTLCKQGWQF